MKWLTPRVVEEMQKSDAFTKEINQAAKLFQRGMVFIKMGLDQQDRVAVIMFDDER